jgi:hypothetical protein
MRGPLGGRDSQGVMLKRLARSLLPTAILLAPLLSMATAESEGQVRAGTASVAVLQWLQRTGCRVHQPAQGPLDDRPLPRSLIRGRFRNPASHDWAVLCVARDSTLLLVFPGGHTDVIDTIKVRVAPTDPTRRIYAAPPSEVRMYVTSLPSLLDQEDEPTDTARMTHDGIVDAVDCCGVVWYWDANRWRQLPGPD